MTLVEGRTGSAELYGKLGPAIERSGGQRRECDRGGFASLGGEGCVLSGGSPTTTFRNASTRTTCAGNRGALSIALACAPPGGTPNRALSRDRPRPTQQRTMKPRFLGAGQAISTRRTSTPDLIGAGAGPSTSRATCGDQPPAMEAFRARVPRPPHGAGPQGRAPRCPTRFCVLRHREDVPRADRALRRHPVSRNEPEITALYEVRDRSPKAIPPCSPATARSPPLNARRYRLDDRRRWEPYTRSPAHPVGRRSFDTNRAPADLYAAGFPLRTHPRLTTCPSCGALASLAAGRGDLAHRRTAGGLHWQKLRGGGLLGP